MLAKRTPIRKSRKAARPGRVKGKEMAALRLLAYLRDDGACVDCGKVLDWASFHLHHIRNKRMWGDNLDNLKTLCPDCHHSTHNPKVVPPKRPA